MSNVSDNLKLKLVIKTFLCANRGKWFTSKQLCDFINSNRLVGRSGITPAQLSQYLKPQLLRSEGIDRVRRNGRNVWHYSIGGAMNG